MILTLSDFQRNSLLELPHAKPAIGQADNTGKIEVYIDKYERDILIQPLGRSIFDEVKSNSADFENAPENIRNLVLGVDYIYEDTEVRWAGLQNNESCLAYYLFWAFNQDDFDYKGTFGLERTQDYYTRSVNAYRNFIAKYQREDKDIINIERSLRQFLCDNEDVYGNQDNFKEYGRTNVFGI